MAAERLTPKERMRRALSGSALDLLPAAPAYLSLFLDDFVRGYYVELYRRRTRGCSRYPLDHAEDTRFRAEALYAAYGIFKSRPDWLELYQGPTRAWAEQTVIVSEAGRLYYEDQLSGRRAPMERVSFPYSEAGLAETNPAAVDVWDRSAEIQSRADVDAGVTVVSAEELLSRGDFDLPRQVVADYGHHFFTSAILDTPFSDTYDLLGFQGMMLLQYDRPELFHYLLQRKLAQLIELARAWAAVGIDGAYVQETFTGADTISARSFDEFVLAYNRPYFASLARLGLLSIYYLCGNALPRLEQMVELELAAVAVEESKKNFKLEIETVVRQVAGRAAVFGNIDAVRFGAGTPQEMAAEVRRQARAGTAVISTGSPFPLDTNPRLLDMLVETAHTLTPMPG